MNTPIPAGVITLRKSQRLSTIPLDIWRPFAAGAQNRELAILSLWSLLGVSLIGGFASSYQPTIALTMAWAILAALCMAISIMLVLVDRRAERAFVATHAENILSRIPAPLNPVSTYPTGAAGFVATRNNRIRRRAEELGLLVQGIARIPETRNTVIASRLTALVHALEAHVSMPSYDIFAHDFANSRLPLPSEVQQRVTAHKAWRVKHYQTHDAVFTQMVDLEAQLKDLQLQERVRQA